jgi:hypothetical protein
MQTGACGGLGGYGGREEATERMWAMRDADIDAACVVDDARRALCARRHGVEGVGVADGGNAQRVGAAT